MLMEVVLSPEEEESYLPYTCRQALKIQLFQQPLSKLEQIHVTFKHTLPKEINNFYSEYKMEEKIFLDSDDLHALGLYLIQELEEPNLWIDVIFLKLFLSEEEKLESKAWSLFFLEATFEFLKEIASDPNWIQNHSDIGPSISRTSQELRRSHR